MTDHNPNGQFPNEGTDNDDFGLIALQQQKAEEARMEALIEQDMRGTQADAPMYATVEEAMAPPAAPLTPAAAKEVDLFDKVEAPVFKSEHDVRVRLSRPVVTDRQTPAYETIDAPSARSEYAAGMVKNFPNMSQDRSGPDLEWGRTTINGMATLPLNNQYERSLGREGSDWRQGMLDGDTLVYSRIPKLPSVSNQKLSGEAAVQRAISYLGIGDIYGVGLWNSGFWVTFKPAPDSAWLELNRMLGADDIRLGRMTYGLVHSGMTALTAMTIVNFLLQFVYSTSVDPNEMPITEIPKHLSVHDIPNFIMGFVAANFPHGYLINRACIADPKICRHTVEQTLDVTEAQIVDNSHLSSPELRAHMRKRQAGSVKIADVIKYQETLPANTSSTVELKTGSAKVLKLRLAPPSAEREFEAAHAHVDEIVTGVQRTVTADTTVRRRSDMLNEAFSASELRTFEHWIKEIEFDTNSVEGIEDIQDLLNYFTRDHTLRESFYDAVSAYIDKSVVSIMALSPLVCPKCGAVHQTSRDLSPEFSDMIPIDVIQVFSLLAEYKSRLILSRLGTN